MKFLTADRPSRSQTFLEIARVISKRATCARASQGAVLVRDNRIIATGYNGPLAGHPHCNDEICDISLPCQRAVHAEINVIYYAAKHGISTNGCDMFCTTAPCKKCAEGLVQAGIKTVTYIEIYRSNEGLKLLEEAGCLVVQENIKDAK